MANYQPNPYQQQPPQPQPPQPPYPNPYQQQPPPPGQSPYPQGPPPQQQGSPYPPPPGQWGQQPQGPPPGPQQFPPQPRQHHQQQPPHPAGPKVPALGRLIGVGIILVGLIFCGFFAWQGLYAAGVRGTHGDLKVERCTVHYDTTGSHRHRRTHRKYDCYGTFTSDNEKITDNNAVLDDSQLRYAAHENVSVTRAGKAVSLSRQFDYVVSDSKHAGYDFAGAFALLIVVALGIFCTATGYFPGNRCEVSYDQAWRSSARGATRPVIMGLGAIGALGALVSLLLGFVL